MLDISETLVVRVDMLPNNIPIIMVARRDFPQLHFVTKLFGKNALAAYSMLTSTRVKPTIGEHGVAHCPNCDRDIHGLGKINFCSNCGMGLDWSFTEGNKKEENTNMKGGK